MYLIDIYVKSVISLVNKISKSTMPLVPILSIYWVTIHVQALASGHVRFNYQINLS